MTSTPNSDPTIFDLFASFFASYQPDADDQLARRIALVRDHLMSHLDAEGWRVLESSAFFDAEIQFRPKGSFARYAHASDLFCILEHYLIPAHAQVGIDQRQVQLDVVRALARLLWDEHYVSTATVRKACRIEFDIAMRSARQQLAEARQREQLVAR